MNVVVTGSIAYDYLMTFPGYFREHILPDQIARLSVSFLVDSMHKQRGGVAPNIAYNLALLGEHPILMATAGQDFAEYRAWLEAHGVDVSAVVEVPDKFTASFFVNTDRENNQIASFYTGAMADASKLSFRNLKARVDLAIISPNDPEAMRKYPRECQELGIPYIYDPSQQIPRLTPEQLLAGMRGARVLIVNDYEFGMIRNRTGLSEGDIQNLVEVVVITHGERGSSIRTRDTVHPIPCVPPRHLADPTGVGDAYRAGLIAGMRYGLPWEIAGRMGSLAATYALEEHGTQRHHYTLDGFIARYGEHFGDGSPLQALRPA